MMELMSAPGSWLYFKMKDKIFYDANPTMDDFYKLWKMLSRPQRPDLIINGIDFNERLDRAKELLHERIDARRHHSILIWREPFGKSEGMQIAWRKHPFIITPPQV